MLNASVICRLLLDDEQPLPPADPQPLDTPFDPDAVDPKAEVMRYAEQPFRVPGGFPTQMYRRMQIKLGDKQRKKVANNTFFVRRGENYAVQFHQTDVVTYEPDGKIVVRTGGWHPGGRNADYGWKMAAGTTTMDRINSNLDSGWRIYKTGAKRDRSSDGAWYWYNHTTGAGRADSEALYPFTEGDSIYPDGSLLIQAHPIYKQKRTRRA